MHSPPTLSSLATLLLQLLSSIIGIQFIHSGLCLLFLWFDVWISEEREESEWLNRFMVRYHTASQFVCLELMHTVSTTQTLCIDPCDFVNDLALLLLDLHQLFYIPGELLAHIIIISYILDINEVLFKDSIKYLCIISIGVTS
jgi:hypothetical protein